MNRESFYAYLRRRDSGVFGTSLSPKQVMATEAILDEGEGLPLPHLAHVLAEDYHETGGGMWPVKETVYRNSKNQNPTDAQVIARLDKAYAAGKLPWVKAPYWRSGAFGRGGIQLTHWINYRKLSRVVGVDLVRDPDRALDPVISARIAVEGCRLGLFTGKKLADFDGEEYDHYNARAIVNGDKRKNGRKVAGYAKAFEAALRAANYSPRITPPATPEALHPQESQEPRKAVPGSRVPVKAIAAILAALATAAAWFWDKIAAMIGL